MATPKETLWGIEQHTEAKHEILRRYLSAWFPILGKYNNNIVYIDGFSGPGRYEGGQPGSPLIALDVAISHIDKLTSKVTFWFIDERTDRIEHLKSELSNKKIPNHFNVNPEVGKFHEKFVSIKSSIELGDKRPNPTFAFLDPFGFAGIPFSIIKKLLSYKRCEVLITFMVNAVNRFIEMPGIQESILETFGTDEALRIAKESKIDRIENLRELYQKQLKSAAIFVRFFKMCNKNNRPIYFLFFATNNELGHIKMKESMWKVDESGNFIFSDATNPNQQILFDPGIEQKEILSKQIYDKFKSGRLVPSHQIRMFVENETAYLKKHMTSAMIYLESENKIFVEEFKSNGKRRKKNSFPDDSLISFTV